MYLPFKKSCGGEHYYFCNELIIPSKFTTFSTYGLTFAIVLVWVSFNETYLPNGQQKIYKYISFIENFVGENIIIFTKLFKMIHFIFIFQLSDSLKQ